jgi:hypothetical protein
VKRIIFIVIVLFAVIGAGWYWWKGHSQESKSTEVQPPEAKTSEEARIKRDEQGRVVLKMSHETQVNLGLLAAKPEAAQLNLEVKGYGRVLDPRIGIRNALFSPRAAPA